MTTDELNTELIATDSQDLEKGEKSPANHGSEADGLSFCAKFLQWVGSSAAICVLILDRTVWRTDVRTALWIPYIFFFLPSILFDLFRGEVGKWFALVAVILRLFFPTFVPDWLEILGALVLLIVVAPSFFAGTLRRYPRRMTICFVIACHLFLESIQEEIDMQRNGIGFHTDFDFVNQQPVSVR